MAEAVLKNNSVTGEYSEMPPSNTAQSVKSMVCEDERPALLTYGQLAIIGYNGYIPPGDKGRKRSKFTLQRRAGSGNGVKPGQQYVRSIPQSPQDQAGYRISYALSENQTVVVEYQPDDENDMFQLGRSSETPIDFVVLDTIPGNKRDNNQVIQRRLRKPTVSRFACRIIAHRQTGTVQVYAGGFDSSRNIFLGEKAIKWQDGTEIDGLTTNGVLINQPSKPFCGDEPQRGIWLEVSVGGKMYVLREFRFTPQKGMKIEEATNVLQDGTLIDLGGATLLWRSPEGLAKSPTRDDIAQMAHNMAVDSSQCGEGVSTVPSATTATTTATATTATTASMEEELVIYLNCGHVHSLHTSDLQKESTVHPCSICLKVGPIAKLCLGIEGAFYVDRGPPTYCFNPCGHVCSEKTAKYWAGVAIPHGTLGYHAICPFCATPLEGNPGFLRLIFSTNYISL